MWTDAQKTVINAAHASTLANLAADLSGRNANEALDDPIAIAAAQKAAADGVKAAWQNVANLQARAASTFAGTGPNGGGFAMTFAGFTGWVGDQFDIAWAGGVGAAQGLAAAVDGFIPYFDPFEQTYASTDGTIDVSLSSPLKKCVSVGGKRGLWVVEIVRQRVGKVCGSVRRLR